MFSGLRLRLTLLYLAIGLAFLLVVGGGTYLLLRGYYRQTTDLALQHRLGQELRARALPLPPDLATAEAAWYASRGRPAPSSPTATPPPAAGDARGDGGEGEGGEDDEDEHGAAELTGRPTAPAGASAGGERTDDESFEEAYDGELAAIFLHRLGPDGRPVAGASAAPLAPVTSTAAVAQALHAGRDWRSVRMTDGTAVRLLTYAVPDGSGSAVLQLGRPLADQERVLRQLMLVLLGLGALSGLLLAVGGWWLAGRSLRPAEQAWYQQQAFVANASHELRTPLTLIRASTEVLGRSLPPGGADRALVDDILGETDHMSRLVRDLLLLSRADSGRLAVAREPVGMDALCADLGRQFGRLASARGVDVAFDGGMAVALADPTRLRQALLALLDNALRHTPAGGAIRLSAVTEGSHVIVTVADTGPGISPEHLPHVFDRFYRAEPGASEGGAGLGLAVVKALVEAQDGRIRLDSAAASGTRAIIRLPAA